MLCPFLMSNKQSSQQLPWIIFRLASDLCFGTVEYICLLISLAFKATGQVTQLLEGNRRSIFPSCRLYFNKMDKVLQKHTYDGHEYGTVFYWKMSNWN